MFESMCDWIAWGIALSVVIIFIVLLCVDGYNDYKEKERRRQRREARHG